ncbi:O-antigen ligase family protein [Gracilibacillus dipsosauri]|nr:O-antigen ligase family protein [Gracilibacillus dipsosauri]
MILIILFSITIAVLLCTSYLIYPDKDTFVKTNILIAIFKTVPSILVAYIITKTKKVNIYNAIFAINIFMTISLLKYLLLNASGILVNLSINFGGVNYNDYSYISALNIALGFYLIYYQMANSKSLRLVFLTITTLMISYLSVILSGGRGALLVSIILLIVFLLTIFKKYSVNFNLKKLLVISITFIGVSIIGSLFLNNNDSIIQGLQRGFSFLNGDDGLIDWDNTSGRLNIYKHSWQLITERPILGYGIGAVFFIHPVARFSHNIFLDILLDGGIIFLLISLLIIISVSTKALKRVLKPNYYLFFNLFLFSFLNLLTGSNYFLEPIFWFSITAIFLLNDDKSYIEGAK